MKAQREKSKDKQALPATIAHFSFVAINLPRKYHTCGASYLNV